MAPVRRVVAVLVVSSLCVAVSAPAAPPRGTLSVSHRLDASAGPYIEGSIAYLRAVRRGRVIVRRSSQALRWRVRRQLRAGLYRVSSFQRPCSGNCSTLDPPIDRCSRRVRVYGGERTSVRIVTRPGRGCRVAVRASAAFPPRRAVAAARRYVSGRAGSSFALIDSHGLVRGLAPRRRYISASVSKAMLLVAYLRKIGNRMPNASERASLGPMITMSDNGRADAIYAQVGDSGLQGLARRVGMRDFAVYGYWGSVFFSALDQARFFYRFDSLVPRRSRGYARRLPSSIVELQRWGFSRVARRAGWRTYFKGGWRGTAAGSLVHEAALFERGGRRFSLAVLTDGAPSHEYGTETLRGVARRLFGSRGPGAGEQ